MPKTTPYDLGVRAFAEFKRRFPMDDKYFCKEYLRQPYETPEKFKFFNEWLNGYSNAEYHAFKKLEDEFKRNRDKTVEAKSVNLKKKK
jgi:hypothetical protein